MAKKFIVLLLGALLCGLSLYAQVNATGALAGTVTDKSGAVVPNANVKITSKDTGAARETTSSGAGQYRFDLLAAGTYEVRASITGFANATYQNVNVSVSQVTTVDVSLAPSSQAETVTVEANGAALVDLAKTDVSLPISIQQIQDLPLNGRDFVNLAYLAPGARPVNSYDPTKNRIGVFAVDGSSGRNVNVTVNGIDDKDNTVGGPVMQLPLEAVSEFQISTQRFSAANGRSEGALITAITKSGTNQLHGSLYLFDRNQALNGTGFFSATKPDYSRQQFGGSIGGPVRKDKDFVFFALEREREATAIAVTPTAFNELSLAKANGFAADPVTSIPTPYFDWRYNGRWDHRFNDRNSLSFSYSNQNNTGQNDQSGSSNDLTQGNFTKNQLILASLNLSSVISPNVVNSVTVGYQYWNNLIDSTIRANNISFPDASLGTNINVPQQSFQKKWQFKDDLSISRGKHTFKVGFDYLYEPVLGGFFENNPTPTISFFADPSAILADKVNYPQGFATPGAVSSISETAGNPYFILSTKMFGVYFQDDWKVSRRLTVNLGLRYDRDYNLNGASAQPISRGYLALKAINSPYAGIPEDDKKDFSPRVGFAYDLTGKGKHIIRGGFGLYFGQIFENIPLFMVQQSNSTIFTTVLSLANPAAPKNGVAPSTAADVVPGTGGKLLSQFRYGVDPIPAVPAPPTQLGAGSTARIMDPNYHNPYTEQENIGYAWSINDSNVVEVDYVHVLGLREDKAVNINYKNPAIAGSPRVLTAAFQAAGLPVLSTLTDLTSSGRSRYDGLNFQYRRRFSRRIGMNASYVLSRALAYRGAAASYSSAPSNVTNYLASYDLGPTPSDERHRFVLSGVVALPWGIKFAPIMQLASARPYTAVQGTDYFGFGTSGSSEQALVLASDPTNFTATKGYTLAQLQTCLSSGTCKVSQYDALRGTPFFQLDARFSKVVTFRERMKLEFFFQAFNMTNRANFGGTYGGNITSATFGKPTGFITPSAVVIPQFFSGEAGFTFRF
jgi:hypothetical protein